MQRSPARADRSQLTEQAVDAIEQVAAHFGWDRWRGQRRVDRRVAGDMVECAIYLLTEQLAHRSFELSRSELQELSVSLAKLQRTRRAFQDRIADERLRALAGLQAVLVRLQAARSVASLLDRATEEVCNSSGFDRAILFRVDGRKMLAHSVHDEGDAEGAAALLEAARKDPPVLSQLPLETEMVRRRVPMLVLDPETNPDVHRPLALATRSRGYVAAPVFMRDGEVICFVHADRHRQDRQVDEFDRDLLWVFAEAFGSAIHRTVSSERLRAQRDEVTAMLARITELMSELGDEEPAIAALDEDPALGRAASAAEADPPAQLRSLLTPREVDVIRLMATGETNASIATRLGISEATVKSHVKHILRKLRAGNRAEAVSRYVSLTAPPRAEQSP
jgi:DNA-binding CsgD family transcriptional regulator